MDLNRRNLAPIHCASTDAGRVNLKALRFEKDGTTVATDGHILAICRRATPKHGEHVPLDPFSLPLPPLAPILKEQRKAKPAAAVIDTATTNANSYCRIESGGVATEIPKVDGEDFKYPDYRAVIPTEPVMLSVGLSLHNLEKVVTTARQFTGTRKGEVTVMRFDFRENCTNDDGQYLNGVTVTCNKNGHGDTLEFVVMPTRLT